MRRLYIPTKYSGLQHNPAACIHTGQPLITMRQILGQALARATPTYSTVGTRQPRRHRAAVALKRRKKDARNVTSLVLVIVYAILYYDQQQQCERARRVYCTVRKFIRMCGVKEMKRAVVWRHQNTTWSMPACRCTTTYFLWLWCWKRGQVVTRLLS